MLCDYPEAKSVVKRDVFGSGFGLASPWGYKKALAFLTNHPDKAREAGVSFEDLDKSIKAAQGLLRKVGTVIPNYEGDAAVHRAKKPQKRASAAVQTEPVYQAGPGKRSRVDQQQQKDDDAASFYSQEF